MARFRIVYVPTVSMILFDCNYLLRAPYYYCTSPLPLFFHVLLNGENVLIQKEKDKASSACDILHLLCFVGLHFQYSANASVRHEQSSSQFSCAMLRISLNSSYRLANHFPPIFCTFRAALVAFCDAASNIVTIDGTICKYFAHIRAVEHGCFK